jgi:hypothetical protein
MTRPTGRLSIYPVRLARGQASDATNYRAWTSVCDPSPSLRGDNRGVQGLQRAICNSNRGDLYASDRDSANRATGTERAEERHEMQHHYDEVVGCTPHERRLIESAFSR